MDQIQRPMQRAQLLSTVGAGVLGAGLALLLRQWLDGFTVAFLVAGLVTHGWGMYTKHRLEQRSDVPRAGWEEVLYWSCWIGLALLAAYVVVSAFDLQR